jgi:hypothetical protein
MRIVTHTLRRVSTMDAPGIHRGTGTRGEEGVVDTNIWSYSRDYASEPLDVQGFKVEAVDGDIGKVDEATYEVASSYIVVDTGPWIFGRKVVLPAGVIERIDLENEKVLVRLTKDQIKDSPELDESTDYRSEEYRSRLGEYYGPYVGV